jgi:hypothetical protein
MKRQNTNRQRLFNSRLSAQMALALSGASAVIGCQTPAERDLGWTLDTREANVEASDEAPTEPFGTPIQDFVGHWIGTAHDPLAFGADDRAYAFASGSTSIVLDLSLSAPNPEGGFPSVAGRLSFGTGAPPAAPTDPNVGYPSDASYASMSYFGQGPLNAALYHGPLPPYEGFEYSVSQLWNGVNIVDRDNVGLGGLGNVADGVLSLRYDTQELLDPWCRLQEPISDRVGGFSCMGPGVRIETEDGRCLRQVDNFSQLVAGIDVSTLSPDEWDALVAQIVVEETEEVDCNKLFLCSTSRCECDETSCSANFLDQSVQRRGVNMSMGSSAQLTLRRTGDTLIGVFGNAVFSNERGLNAPIGAVTFTLQE